MGLEGFPGGTRGKEFTCQCRRHKTYEFDPWVGKIPGEGNGNPLQFSCWRILWTEEPGGLQFYVVTESDTTEATEHA